VLLTEPCFRSITAAISNLCSVLSPGREMAACKAHVDKFLQRYGQEGERAKHCGRFVDRYNKLIDIDHTNNLLRPDWRPRWRDEGRLYPGWFELPQPCGRKHKEDRHRMISFFEKALAFVVDDTNDLKGLLEAADEYLKSRNIQTAHPDGPEGGRWIWWNNVRYPIAKGKGYQLVEFMWGRESARLNDLIGPDLVWEDGVEDSAIKSCISRANVWLRGIPLPWELTFDSTSDHVRKKQRAVTS
jgi:hypothetical protein